MATDWAAQAIPAFNALADQMTAPVDLQKPYILANNTSSSIVQKIDGIDKSLETGRRGIPGRGLVLADAHQKSKYAGPIA